MRRGLDSPVNIRISNEYFVGYSDVKIPANSKYKLYFGQNKEKIPIIIIKNKETVYCYEEDELVKELMYSYWNLCIPYNIIIKNETNEILSLNDKNLKIYITNEE